MSFLVNYANGDPFVVVVLSDREQQSKTAWLARQSKVNVRETLHTD